MANHPNLLTVADVAGLLQIRKSTVYVWAEQGRLPVVRVGRLLRFEAHEIQSWLTERKLPGRPHGRGVGSS